MTVAEQVVEQACNPVWRMQRFAARVPAIEGQWVKAEVYDYNRVP